MKVKLEDVCAINPHDQNTDLGKEVSFIPMSCVSDDGDVDLSHTRSIHEVKKGYTPFRNGDVLMAKITPCMENLKGAYVTGLMNGIGYGSTEFHVLRANDNIICAEWLYYFSVSKKFRQDCERNMTGSGGQKRVSTNYLAKYVLTIPSIQSQKQQTQTLTQLKNIIKIRRQQLRTLDELVKCRFVEMFGDCRVNSKQWATKKLEDIAAVGSSKRVFAEELVSEGIPFYRGTEIGALADGMAFTPELYISKEHYSRLCAASGKPSRGDLLMPSICPDGRIWVVDTDKPFYFKDGRVLWVHDIHEQYNPIFLLYTLKDRIIADYNSIASGTTFAELKIFTLKQCKVFDVPSAQQNAFATFVQQLDKSRFAIQRSLEETQKLFDSLMQEYFS